MMSWRDTKSIFSIKHPSVFLLVWDLREWSFSGQWLKQKTLFREPASRNHKWASCEVLMWRCSENACSENAKSALLKLCLMKILILIRLLIQILKTPIQATVTAMMEIKLLLQTAMNGLVKELNWRKYF